jgi:hypothetical protein
MRAAKINRVWGGGSMSLLALVPGRPATGAWPGLLCWGGGAGWCLRTGSQCWGPALGPSLAGDWAQPQAQPRKRAAACLTRAAARRRHPVAPGSKASIDMSKYQTLSEDQKQRIAAVLAQVRA